MIYKDDECPVLRLHALHMLLAMAKGSSENAGRGRVGLQEMGAAKAVSARACLCFYYKFFFKHLLNFKLA